MGYILNSDSQTITNICLNKNQSKDSTVFTNLVSCRFMECPFLTRLFIRPMSYAKNDLKRSQKLINGFGFLWSTKKYQHNHLCLQKYYLHITWQYNITLSSLIEQRKKYTTAKLEKSQICRLLHERLCLPHTHYSKKSFYCQIFNIR